MIQCQAGEAPFFFGYNDMTRVFLYTICLLMLVRTAPATDSSSVANKAAERAAIQSVLDAHGTAWTKGDPKAAAAVMTDDADWVSGDGSVFSGKAEIEEMHREALATNAKGSIHTHPGTPKIRFVRPDVALVDGDSYMSGVHDDSGKELPSHLSRYCAVMVKDKGRWRVIAFRSLPQVKVEVAK